MKKEDKKMKTYKLIKKYPGSPASLGLEINKNGNYWQSNFCTDTVEHFHKSFNEFNPTDYPEFWQEVVEKDYEILSFIYINRIDTKRENGLFGLEVPKRDYQKKGNYSENSYSNDCWNIYSVKRLSDGEVFTIGDKVKCWDGIKTIFDIYLHPSSKHELRFWMKNQIGCKLSGYTLDHIQKSKQPLFKTEDGVDIYEGDEYYYVDGYYLLRKSISSKTLFTDKRSFSTKEKAEEYIIMNKPCLSINDINFLKTEGFCFWDRKLKELVKSKI